MGRGYFSIIPAPVRDAPVPDKAKLLYAEVSALAEDTGYCWASNAALAERLDCSERTISRSISQLSEIGVIRVETVPRADRSGGKERQIFVGAFVQTGVDKNGETSGGHDKNGETGHDKNGETILNKLSNTVRDIPPISPTEKPKAKTEAQQIVEEFGKYTEGDRELCLALNGFMAKRKALKKPIDTLRGFHILLGKLDRFSGGDSAAKVSMLDEATEHGWLTVYPLKGDAPTAVKPSSSAYSEEGYDGI